MSLSILDPPSDQNQRFCYRITGVGEDISTYIDLSHWVLAICPEITREQITNISVTINDTPQEITDENVVLFIPPDTDPTTGCSGLKFDFALSKVLGEPDSVGLFCFELTTRYPVGGVNVCLKGGSISVGTKMICGPVCPEVCETTTSQLINICLPVTIEPFACLGRTRTVCCGSAVIGDVPCSGQPNGSCTFTVSQLLCVEVPITFGANTIPGNTYVRCGAPTPGTCECPPEDD